jgi:hypothetical protein
MVHRRRLHVRRDTAWGVGVVYVDMVAWCPLRFPVSRAPRSCRRVTPAALYIFQLVACIKRERWVDLPKAQGFIAKFEGQIAAYNWPSSHLNRAGLTRAS